MKVVQRIGLLLFLYSQLALCGFGQHGIITTYVGASMPVMDTQAITQAIAYPGAVAVDGTGGFYVSSWAQSRIYRVAANGSISLTAGGNPNGYSGDGGPATAAQLNKPDGVAVDSAGNLFIADSRNYRIRKVTTKGIISTVAGNGTFGYSGDGGPATAAQLNGPKSVAVDLKGNLFITDDNRICKVTPAGIISTVAGNGNFGYSGDGGVATAAQLNWPSSVVVDSAGNLLIADRNNHRIRKVTSAGIISTVVGNGNQDYPNDYSSQATSTNIGAPVSVTIDSADNLYFVESGYNRIRKVTTTGIISTVVGSRTSGYSGNGVPTTEAQINDPSGVAVDSAGNILVADHNNHRIHKVTTSGIISTLAGNGNPNYSGDGGPASTAQLYSPHGVAIDFADNLYITDSYNHRIRKVTTTGIISTVAGNGTSGLSGDGGIATAAQLCYPHGVAIDSKGNFYIADTDNQRIRKVTTAGIISTVAGNGTSGFSGDGGPATAAHLNGPTSVAVDSAGNLFIADLLNNRIRKVTSTGIISTVVGNGTSGFSGDGGLATAAQLYSPSGVAVDFAGNLFIADSLNGRIRKVTTSGTISTVAGNGTSGFSGDGVLATAAQLRLPNGVAVDSAGNLYIEELINNRIRKVSTSGTISTVADDVTIADGYQSYVSLGDEVQSSGPNSVAIDSASNLYFADTNNNRIRKIKQ